MSLKGANGTAFVKLISVETLNRAGFAGGSNF
jgi:hypothetical protein